MTKLPGRTVALAAALECPYCGTMMDGVIEGRFSGPDERYWDCPHCRLQMEIGAKPTPASLAEHGARRLLHAHWTSPELKASCRQVLWELRRAHAASDPSNPEEPPR